mgnify:FL=1
MVLFIEKRLSTVNKLGPKEKREDRKLRISNCTFGSDKKNPSISKRGDSKVIA